MGKTSPGEPSGSVPPGSASPPAPGPLPPAVRCQQRITSGLGRAPRALPGEASLRLEDCGADSSRSWKAASFQAPRLLPASPPPRVTPLGTGWPWPVALSEEVSPFFFFKATPLAEPCLHPCDPLPQLLPRLAAVPCAARLFKQPIFGQKQPKHPQRSPSSQDLSLQRGSAPPQGNCPPAGAALRMEGTHGTNPWSRTHRHLQGMLERAAKTHSPWQKWDRAVPPSPPRSITPSVRPRHGKSPEALADPCQQRSHGWMDKCVPRAGEALHSPGPGPPLMSHPVACLGVSPCHAPSVHIPQQWGSPANLGPLQQPTAQHSG